MVETLKTVKFVFSHDVNICASPKTFGQLTAGRHAVILGVPVPYGNGTGPLHQRYGPDLAGSVTKSPVLNWTIFCVYLRSAISYCVFDLRVRTRNVNFRLQGPRNVIPGGGFTLRHIYRIPPTSQVIHYFSRHG